MQRAVNGNEGWSGSRVGVECVPPALRPEFVAVLEAQLKRPRKKSNCRPQRLKAVLTLGHLRHR